MEPIISFILALWPLWFVFVAVLLLAWLQVESGLDELLEDDETPCGCDFGCCCGFCDCCPCTNHIEKPGQLCPTCGF